MMPATIAFNAAMICMVRKSLNSTPNRMAAMGSQMEDSRHHFMASHLLRLMHRAVRHLWVLQ